MSDRLEPRTPNTASCPDDLHQHSWRRRRPELTEGVDPLLQYYAEPNGAVTVSEEMLSRLLRQAGFVPVEKR